MAINKMRKTNYRLFGGVNEKTSKYTLADSQVSDLKNMDFNIPNALNKRPGSTSMVFANTSGPINSMIEFERLSGESYLVASSNSGLFFLTAGATFSDIATGLSGQPMDFLVFTDRLYAANGQTFYNWTGESLLTYQTPCPGDLSDFGADVGVTIWLGVTGSAGSFQTWASYSFLRVDGYYGPLSTPQPQIAGDLFTFGASMAISGFSIPSNQGITAIAFYLHVKSNQFNPENLGVLGTTEIPNSAMRFITFLPTSTATIIINAADFNYQTIYDDGNGFSGQPFCFGETYKPRYIEINQNRMFLSGFSSNPSFTFWSEVAQPEIVKLESFFETRTNDGDRITGIKSYNDELVVFKRNSFHKLIGDNEDNYQLVEISTEYGCLSNKAIIEFSDRLVFLDEKGIVLYNGASWSIISNQVEETFRRMNISAAIENAVAIHNDFRNQVWFGIPVDGSTENNLTVVYDYLLDSWTFFDGFSPASFTMAKRALARDHLWFGDYSGNIHYSSPSFYGDNGVAISCVVDPKFDAPDGENVTNMFRQLFLDVNTVSGITGVVNCQVFSDYDRSSIKATFDIFQDQFQTRRDFGVPGKSVAFRFGHNSASLPLTMHGYTVRRRFLREV